MSEFGSGSGRSEKWLVVSFHGVREKQRRCKFLTATSVQWEVGGGDAKLGGSLSSFSGRSDKSRGKACKQQVLVRYNADQLASYPIANAPRARIVSGRAFRSGGDFEGDQCCFLIQFSYIY